MEDRNNPPEGYELVKEGQRQPGDLYWNISKNKWLPVVIFGPIMNPTARKIDDNRIRIPGRPSVAPEGYELITVGTRQKGDLFFAYSPRQWVETLKVGKEIDPLFPAARKIAKSNTPEPQRGELYASW